MVSENHHLVPISVCVCAGVDPEKLRGWFVFGAQRGVKILFCSLNIHDGVVIN